VPEDQPIVAEEVFGPVVSILGYTDENDAVRRVNEGPYGLQAGVFSGSINRAFKLARALNVRGVQINDGPAFREDTWPYGGRKASGRGTEGPHWAIREMSVAKLFVVNL
jgi:succinate-semialdehyde dehydrogenase / glutarate-semialdehyde dehydrogenase